MKNLLRCLTNILRPKKKGCEKATKRTNCFSLSLSLSLSLVFGVTSLLITHLFFCLLVTTHQILTLFRTQWLLFPPPRYVNHASLHFLRESPIRVGGFLARVSVAVYFSSSLIKSNQSRGDKKRKFPAS